MSGHLFRSGMKLEGEELGEMSLYVHLPFLPDDWECAKEPLQWLMVVPIFKAAVSPHVPTGNDVDRFVKGEGLGTNKPPAFAQINKDEKGRKNEAQSRTRSRSCRPSCNRGCLSLSGRIHQGPVCAGPVTNLLQVKKKFHRSGA